MAKLEMDVVYKLNPDYKDERTITWRDRDLRECYKIACEIVADARPEQSVLVANSDMVDLWVYDDNGDIQAHWYYRDDIDGWFF